MLKINVYNTDAKVVGEMELNGDIFGQEFNEALIHQVVVAQLANKRQGTKSTLTRAEVRGGGAKPWKQKGTGRARQGSIRSPQWIKGGVVFAPKPRDFSQKINKQMKRSALKSALSAKVADGKFIVLDDIRFDAPKTKDMAVVIKNFNIDKKTLLVLSGDNTNAILSARNIQSLKTTDAALVNVYDLAANTYCLITKSAVEKLQEVYA